MKEGEAIYSETFPIRLKTAREQTGLSQMEVSKMLNLKQQTISGYEKGLTEPDLDTLAKLANLYGTTVDWLLTLGPYPGIGLEPDYQDLPSNVIYSIEFQKKIKENRLKKNLPLRTLERAVKISNSTLCNYERGKTQPNLENLAKLAAYYRVSVDWLLGLKETSN